MLNQKNNYEAPPGNQIGLYLKRKKFFSKIDEYRFISNTLMNFLIKLLMFNPKFLMIKR